jgi:heme/copper-type cytochrome/quinol oxidase subunit 4
MGQKDFVIAFVLIFIFSFAIIQFAYNFGVENGSPVNVYNDTDVSNFASSSGSDMGTFTSTSNSSDTSFSQSSIEETAASGTLVTGSAFKSSVVSPIKVFASFMTLGQHSIFGNDSQFNVIFTSIGALIVIIGIFLIWKTWKGGNPE